MSFEVMGYWFGYPPCCIESFTNMLHMDADWWNEDSFFYGTGFVPCESCVTKPPREVLSRIQSLRFCPSMFPLGDMPHMPDDLDDLIMRTMTWRSLTTRDCKWVNTPQFQNFLTQTPVRNFIAVFDKIYPEAARRARIGT